MENAIGIGYDDSSQILTALRLGTAFRFAVTIKGLTVPLRPLSMDEEVSVMHDVHQMLNQNPLLKQDDFYQSTLKAKLTLELASTSRPGEKDFKLTAKELGAWTGDEVQKLFKEYVAIRDKVNPDIEEMTAEQINNVIDLLKKSPREGWVSMLNGLSFSQLKDIICSLIPRD